MSRARACAGVFGGAEGGVEGVCYVGREQCESLGEEEVVWEEGGYGSSVVGVLVDYHREVGEIFAETQERWWGCGEWVGKEGGLVL